MFIKIPWELYYIMITIKIYDMDLNDYFDNPYKWFNFKTGLQINE